MSRQIIRDIVIPIVTKIMREDGFLPYGNALVMDEKLEEFLQEQMRRLFGVIGANECQHLKEQLEEAKKNDPYAFEYVLRQVLQQYVKWQVKLRQAQEKEKGLDGPPDRFAEQRRLYSQMLGRQQESYNV